MNEDATPAVGPWDTLFARLLAEAPRGAQPIDDDGITNLDGTVYTDPARHDAELASLFRCLPLCLGHEDQLRTPGSVLARDLVGLPLLLMRDLDGRIGVFLNSCRHRGACLVEAGDAVVTRSSLSCRYHGWTYDLGGKLLSLPRRDGFPGLDPASRGLRRLPSIVHRGLIWAILDPDKVELPPIDAFLGLIDQDLAVLGLQDHRVFRQHAVKRAANWKLIIDAFLEVYHVKRLHSASIGPFFSDGIAASDRFGPHQRMLVARDAPNDPRDRPVRTLSPQRDATLVHHVFPNSIFVYHPDYISHLGVFPVSVGETMFVHTMLIPEAPADDKARSHWERSFKLIDVDVFNGEDLPICEQIQRGLSGGGRRDIVLGRLERNLQRFHRAVADSIAT